MNDSPRRTGPKHAKQNENDPIEAVDGANRLAARLQSWFSGGVRASLTSPGGNLNDGATHRLTRVWARDDVVFAELDGRIILGVAGPVSLEISEDRFEIVDFIDGRLDWLDEPDVSDHRGEEFACGPLVFERGPVVVRELQVETPAALEADGAKTHRLVH